MWWFMNRFIDDINESGIRLPLSILPDPLRSFSLFNDHYGYDNYDFVVQMDIDHTPSTGYLKAMLQPFWNSRVGYVTAPSICDSNARESWVARGRLFLESTLHGTLQAGCNGVGRKRIIGYVHAGGIGWTIEQLRAAYGPDVTSERARCGGTACGFHDSRSYVYAILSTGSKVGDILFFK
jgi:hypothetical protein